MGRVFPCLKHGWQSNERTGSEKWTACFSRSFEWCTCSSKSMAAEGEDTGTFLAPRTTTPTLGSSPSARGGGTRACSVGWNKRSEICGKEMVRWHWGRMFSWQTARSQRDQAPGNKTCSL